MDKKEILSKIHIDAGLDPHHRFALGEKELKDGKTMILLERFTKKHSIDSEIAAKLCVCTSLDDKSANGSFTLGAEILRDCYGKVNFFVAPVFDAKSFNSTAAILKAYKKDIRVTAVCSRLLPDEIDLSLIDEAVDVSQSDAETYKNEILNTENLEVGTLSGAALKAAADIAQKINNKHARIVVLFPDISN